MAQTPKHSPQRGSRGLLSIFEGREWIFPGWVLSGIKLTFSLFLITSRSLSVECWVALSLTGFLEPNPMVRAVSLPLLATSRRTGSWKHLLRRPIRYCHLLSPFIEKEGFLVMLQKTYPNSQMVYFPRNADITALNIGGFFLLSIVRFHGKMGSKSICQSPKRSGTDGSKVVVFGTLRAKWDL